MLDIRFIRDNPELVKKALQKRYNDDISISEFKELDQKRRDLLYKNEQLRHKRNITSDKIGELKRDGKDASSLIKDMQDVADKIEQYDNQLEEVEKKLDYIMKRIPNIPHEDVPVGKDESENRKERGWGNPRDFDFEFKPHWELGTELDILDFDRGSKVAGSRLTFLKGAGARLERSLINFMLDLHIDEHGYREIFPPFLANQDSMEGTGQLPKFAEDMFKLKDTDYYMIPTAEVPVTNMHRDEILTKEELPKNYVAYSACFRAEAGDHGRDTRGIIRQHQFNKVELVKFVEPQSSYQALEELTGQAEKVLQKLELPYRVVTLCTGDLTFASAKTYDIEVWMPAYDTYREISSCSNFEDFQARRAGIKYRPEAGADSEFVHTLNGSGLAIGRTMAAILENYQNEDGSITVPQVLRPYMGRDRITKH
ncbi:MAG: serine--tRNA ligase [Halanaerobiales bacterium]